MTDTVAATATVDQVQAFNRRLAVLEASLRSTLGTLTPELRAADPEIAAAIAAATASLGEAAAAMHEVACRVEQARHDGVR